MVKLKPHYKYIENLPRFWFHFDSSGEGPRLLSSQRTVSPSGSPLSSAGFKFQPLLEFQPAETPEIIQNGALRCLPTEMFRVQSEGFCRFAVYGSVHRDSFSPTIKIPETENQQLLFLWSEGCQREDRVSGKVQRQSKSSGFYFCCSSALRLLLAVV